MLEHIFKKKDRDVEFLSLEGMRQIISYLNDKQKYSLSTFIDRYVDAKMKEHVKNKINGTNIDENAEMKLRGVMEFKEFLKKVTEM